MNRPTVLTNEQRARAIRLLDADRPPTHTRWNKSLGDAALVNQLLSDLAELLDVEQEFRSSDNDD